MKINMIKYNILPEFILQNSKQYVTLTMLHHVVSTTPYLYPVASLNGVPCELAHKPQIVTNITRLRDAPLILHTFTIENASQIERLSLKIFSQA